jgi:hypothetical protein
MGRAVVIVFVTIKELWCAAAAGVGRSVVDIVK